MTQTTPGTRDVLDLLIAQHRAAEALLASLDNGGSPTEQRETADVLITDLVRHSVGEEAYVYPLMREYLDQGVERVEHDLAEHHELEGMLKELEGMDPSAARFPPLISEIRTLLADHITDEETRQFPQLRMVVPAGHLIDLRSKVESMERMAPTRPHPDAPDSPMVHKLVGPGVGMVDRVRYALSGSLHQ